MSRADVLVFIFWCEVHGFFGTAEALREVFKDVLK